MKRLLLAVVIAAAIILSCVSDPDMMTQAVVSPEKQKVENKTKIENKTNNEPKTSKRAAVEVETKQPEKIKVKKSSLPAKDILKNIYNNIPYKFKIGILAGIISLVTLITVISIRKNRKKKRK